MGETAAERSATKDPANTSSLWKQYRKAKQTDTEPDLADFSYVGYHWGDQEIPTVDWKVFDVTTFGAVANDGKSDKAALIRAIAAAEANGSGVVFFPKGKFRINEKSDAHNQPIFIKGSKIVLRGSGSGEGGTQLFMERHMDPADPNKMWTCPYMIQFIGKGAIGKKSAVVADTRRETRTIEVADASVFKVGDWTVLSLKDNSSKAVARAVAPYKADPSWTAIIEKGVVIDEFHCIESIKGNQLTFKEPIHASVAASSGWTVTQIRPLEEVGVEEIAFRGNWLEKFVHHKSAIHDGGWSALNLSRCVNSWVRNCRFTHFNAQVRAQWSSAVTVQDLLLDGNRGHHAVSLHGTSHSLVQRVNDTASHWHAGGVAGPASGNVFLNCSYPADTCYEAHASQPRWTLFDNTTGGWMYGRWGGAQFNQPNHMHGLVFWNYKNIGKGVPGKFHFMLPHSVYGRIITPYVIGFHGNAQEWAEDEIKVLESNGNPVSPKSLYQAQLELRRAAGE